ncbi:MAG: ASCH domain-containing protein [Firmicutes bacterium]|nr:ASCH domain-containing protein [Bacillota bacterium]MCL2771435.1 ASCH domain-containing protein [Bacillota bacterium]
MEHLAILRQPFLDLILSGEKTIETRWSKNKIAPYKQIAVGDTVLLKESGKKVVATAVVDKVEFYELTDGVFEMLEKKYGKQICMHLFTNKEDIRKRNYATLMWFRNITKCEPMEWKNRGMSGWVVVE